MWCLYISVLMFSYVFFFKQKTAYEMRISDWSSDVCSSDLAAQDEAAFAAMSILELCNVRDVAVKALEGAVEKFRVSGVSQGFKRQFLELRHHIEVVRLHLVDADRQPIWKYLRSEEHTSELQSLMSISYAVFCLKKQNNKETIQI